MEIDSIYNEDCLVGMREIPDKSIYAIICDLPYGVLNRQNKSAQWDNIIPIEPLKQLRKDALNAVALEYNYPNYNVVIYASGYQTTGVIVVNFLNLKDAETYMTTIRRSYILNTARLSRVGGRKIY